MMLDDLTSITLCCTRGMSVAMPIMPPCLCEEPGLGHVHSSQQGWCTIYQCSLSARGKALALRDVIAGALTYSCSGCQLGSMHVHLVRSCKGAHLTLGLGIQLQCSSLQPWQPGGHPAGAIWPAASVKLYTAAWPAPLTGRGLLLAGCLAGWMHVYMTTSGHALQL
jgi:hypothetical protein